MGRDTIQLEDAVSTISQEYLLEFSSEYFIPENLHPELPGPGDHIVDFPEGKIGVYTKKFEFANFRIPISQFLFDILGYYQIHLSQLSVIGAAKVSHFEINCRVLNIIPTVNLFRVFYVPSYNSGWMSFSKRPGKNTPQCYTKPLDSLKNWNNRFFWVDEKVFPTVVAWRTAATKDDKPHANTYSVVDVATLDTHRTPFQKQLEELLCLVGLSHNFFLHDDEYPTFLNDNDQEMDLFNLIKAPNPTKVKTGTRQRAAHEVPLMTATAIRVIQMVDVAELSTSSGTPSTVERSPLDFSNEDASSPSPVTQGIDTGSSKEKGIAGDQDSKGSTPSPPITRSSGSIYQPGWGVPNSCRLDTPEACQDVVDHIASPRYFSKLRHLPNDEFLSQYNMNLAWQVAMGSQLRLRFEQEAKLLKKFVAQVACRDQRIATREKHIKELEAQLEAEINMKKATEVKNSEVTKELEDLRMHFSGLEEFKKHEDERVRARCTEIDARLDALSVDFDEELYPHMLTAIAGRRWVIGHGLRLVVMKCAESTELRQAFANVVSAGIAKGMNEGLKYAMEHGKSGLELTAIEAYDPEADNKYVDALHNLKDLSYSLIDELEQLKDAPLDVIMASLYLESDTGEDAPQSIRDLRPSSSQLKIHVYPEVRNPRNPWACKDEILLGDVIAANISHAKKKKRSRVVCRTHRVGSAHHARSGGIPVLVPTVAPQGLQILLADAATQTKDKESPRLLRSKSLPALFTLDLP
ncbi:hypothetical protein Tco_0908378 [Tanacetum coccineum]|uniref:Transposase (putative) gypsy type domain-containing protein n=1 Tax=Tanacetum coccineum TaxID=301880 RepID=A0ABQ5CMP5_9ASTR